MENMEPESHKNARERLVKFFASCKKGDVDEAGILYELGVPLEAVDAAGCTGLMIAARNNHCALATWLMSQGAVLEISRHTAIARAPLSWAADAGHIEMVNLLLDGGAHVDAIDSGGMSALHLAVREGHGDIVAVLIARQTDVCKITKGGFTSLMYAAMKNNVDIMRVLLRAGADAEYSNESGFTA